MTLASLIKKLYRKYPGMPFHRTARDAYWWLRARPEKLYRGLKAIESTPPLACNPAALTELHTLTCHKHVYMYITAIKSLLRFISGLAIVVHDDGSLTTADITTIEQHIPGARVIRRSDADEIAKKLLASFPKTRAFRDTVINALELTDHGLLAARKKIVVTNSDTLFLRRPDELIRWIASDGHDVLCVYEEAPWQQAEFLSRMKSPFPPHVTLALLCLSKDMVDAAEIEAVLNQVQPTDDPWFIGQNTLPAVIGKKIDPGQVRFLDRHRYQASAVFREGAIFRHYWSSAASLRPQFCADVAQVVAELKRTDLGVQR